MITQNSRDLGAQVVITKIEKDVTTLLTPAYSDLVPPQLKKGSGKYTFETTLLPEAVKESIQKSFNETKKSCEKLCINRTSPELKIKIPRDEFTYGGNIITTKVKEDCLSSSYLQCKNILSGNKDVNVHILQIDPPAKQFLKINSTRAKKNWDYHIVCLVETLWVPLKAPITQDTSKHALIVVDPLLFDGPVTLHDWSNIMLNGNSIEVKVSSLSEWSPMEKLLQNCNN